MANSYYNRYASFPAGTAARGSEVTAEYDLVVGGFNAVEADVETINAAISGLQVGDPPGFGTTIDTRWYATDTSSSSTTYTCSQGASGTEAIPEGYTIHFIANNNNTGASTLQITDTTDGALPIYKVTGGIYAELDADDITTLSPVMLTKVGTQWVLRTQRQQSIASGTVLAFGGSTIPDDYLLCYGQAVSRITYADLFSVISTTYGVGDGSSTFNLPDLRGKTPMGIDDMGGTPANVEAPFKVANFSPDPELPVTVNWIIRT